MGELTLLGAKQLTKYMDDFSSVIARHGCAQVQPVYDVVIAMPFQVYVRTLGGRSGAGTRGNLTRWLCCKVRLFGDVFA